MDQPENTGLDPHSTSRIQLARTALEARIRAFARRSIAKNTERGYRADWADFLEFCDQHGPRRCPRTQRPSRCTTPP
jgi:hypothetical protein